jgi:hypothetical protein
VILAPLALLCRGFLYHCTESPVLRLEEHLAQAVHAVRAGERRPQARERFLRDGRTMQSLRAVGAGPRAAP